MVCSIHAEHGIIAYDIRRNRQRLRSPLPTQEASLVTYEPPPTTNRRRGAGEGGLQSCTPSSTHECVASCMFRQGCLVVQNFERNELKNPVSVLAKSIITFDRIWNICGLRLLMTSFIFQKFSKFLKIIR